MSPQTPNPKNSIYRTITLEKDESGELGIYITGKVDSNGYLGYVVADLEYGGPAFRTKAIDKDDEVLAINGIVLRGLQLEDALRHLRCSDRVVQIIIAKQRATQLSNRAVTSNTSYVDMSLNYHKETNLNNINNTNHTNNNTNNSNININSNDSDKVIDSAVKVKKSKFYSKFSSEKKTFGAFQWLLNQRKKCVSNSKNLANGSNKTPKTTVSTNPSPTVGENCKPNVDLSPTQSQTQTQQKLSTLSRMTINRSCRPISTPNQMENNINFNSNMNSGIWTLPRKPKTDSSQPNLTFRTIVYQKGPNSASLGFTIVGGTDSRKGQMGIFVKTIYPDGQAAQFANLFEGDQIFSINGQSTEGLTHSEVLAMFKRIKRGDVVLNIGRRTDIVLNSANNWKSCSNLDFIT